MHVLQYIFLTKKQCKITQDSETWTMSNSAKYSVLIIPVPPDDDQVLNYRGLRLLATQTNPEIFSSSYESELGLSFARWHARINCAGKATIVVSTRTPIPGCSEDISDWVGMITIIGPQALAGPGFTPPAQVLRPGRAFYLLIGMWVHPDCRRQGLARNLLHAGVDWVRGDNSAEAIGMHATEKAVLLEVHIANEAAVNLYRAMGFQMVAGDDSGALTWMMAIIE
ncbi:hypothetical protein BDQ17DRAFT_575959 [Cyathus striatus]|nr:hypothetical protein BDQ17DRAFT_575959 [Cyathus striatus]